ncbi:MAG: hypothetical protein R3E12_01030 [Candidatus Eisenbacteria bacterium]|uniref:Uncharacterized protein n=1 Tax=Eiseniibacteriota bacterium TaxID=2212470 RepID=A0A956RM60_UNCEI|nr:hypothetical protein [Candidatus Eisenbacteria bacterium]
MRHRAAFLVECAFFITLFLICARPAQAYLDPGSGSMILQLLAAGLVTATVVFRRSLARVVGLFRRDKGSSEK